jgi:hypothetical protein
MSKYLAYNVEETSMEVCSWLPTDELVKLANAKTPPPKGKWTSAGKPTPCAHGHKNRHFKLTVKKEDI